MGSVIHISSFNNEVGQWLRIHLPMQETRVRSFGQEDPLKKEMANHSHILAWETPGTEEPGGLQSTVSQRIRPVGSKPLGRERLNTELPTQSLLVSMN